MKFTIKEVEIENLVTAPWNPRAEITPESVADLVENIRDNGLLQNIGVWNEAGTGRFYVIYGNRRVAACRVLGLKTILAKIYIGSEVEAREQTRSENELRLGIDPLEDSKLLCSIRDKGRTEQEIAAKYGLPIAFVCRRLKLADLAPSVREKLKSGVKVTTDALERISAYPVEIQDHVAKFFRGAGDTTYRWNDISYHINDLTLDLDHGFKFDDCVKCLMRTGSAPTLFGDIEDGRLGRCLNPDCHKRHKAEAIRKRIDAAIDPEVTERVKLRGNHSWTFKEAGATQNKPSVKNPCAYYALSDDGSVTVKYGPSKAAKDEADRRRREKEKAENEKAEANRKRRISIETAFKKWAKVNFVKAIKNYIGSDMSKMIDVVIVFGIYKNCYGYNPRYDFAKWSKNRSVDNFLKVIAMDRITSVVKYGTVSDVRHAVLIFKDVRWKEVFSPDDYKYVMSNDFKNAAH